MITASSSALSHSVPLSLVVNTAPPPNFSLAASPSLQTVTAGSRTSYTATVSALNGFSGSVSLSVSGLPAGATGSFTPASVTGSGTSTLSISSSNTTPPCSYPLTITGTSGSLTHTASDTLTVKGLCVTATSRGP